MSGFLCVFCVSFYKLYFFFKTIVHKMYVQYIKNMTSLMGFVFLHRSDCPSVLERLSLGTNKLIFHPSDITRDFHGNRGDIILLRGRHSTLWLMRVRVCASVYQCKRQRMCNHVCLCVCVRYNGCKCGLGKPEPSWCLAEAPNRQLSREHQSNKRETNLKEAGKNEFTRDICN